MKIALYGGSFDPPHKGHVDVVNKALATLNLDKLIVVPAYRNPFKQEAYATSQQRFHWLNKIFEDFQNVMVSSFEIDQNRSVASYETVQHYKQNGDEIFFIIGADNIASLSKWQHFDYLEKNVSWVVAMRDNITIPSSMLSLDVNVPISSSNIRSFLDHEHIPDVIFEDVYQTYKEKN